MCMLFHFFFCPTQTKLLCFFLRLSLNMLQPPKSLKSSKEQPQYFPGSTWAYLMNHFILMPSEKRWAQCKVQNGAGRSKWKTHSIWHWCAPCQWVTNEKHCHHHHFPHSQVPLLHWLGHHSQKNTRVTPVSFFLLPHTRLVHCASWIFLESHYSIVYGSHPGSLILCPLSISPPVLILHNHMAQVTNETSLCHSQPSPRYSVDF